MAPKKLWWILSLVVTFCFSNNQVRPFSFPFFLFFSFLTYILYFILKDFIVQNDGINTDTHLFSLTIKIILVDVGETKEDVQEYFYRRQMKLVSFVDVDSVLQGAYRLIGVPTLIFIDEKGIIRKVTHEFPSDYTNYFRA